MNSCLAILGYHKIGKPSPGGWESWYYVTEAQFLLHLEILRDQGFEMIDHAALERALDGTEDLPDRAALVTFDDGYRSVHDLARPLLKELGYPAMLFVPVLFVGDYNTFDDGAEPIEAICVWDHLRELGRNRVSIQSHGMSHRPFSDLGRSEQQGEIVDSRRILEQNLSNPVRFFAYPYGDVGTDRNAVAQQLVRAGYRAAFVYDGAVNRGPLLDPYFLSRLTMGPDTDLEKLLVDSLSGRRQDGR